MPPAFTLYGNVISSATNRVRLLLADANFTNYEFVNLNFQKAEHKSPAHLARNPDGRVPVLTTTTADGHALTLYESRAICKYLCARYALPYMPSSAAAGAAGGEAAAGTSPASALVARALFDQAESAEMCQFGPAVDDIGLEKFAKATMGLAPDEARVAHARQRVRRHVDVLEGALAGGKRWVVEALAGEAAAAAGVAGAAGVGAFGLVDIYYLILVHRLKACGEAALVEGSGRANLEAWWERCLERPAVRKFLGELISLEDVLQRLAAAKGSS